MKLSDIYLQIMTQSGVELADTFSNSIPYCFNAAFVETLRIPKSEDSLLPMYEDEITPLLDFHRATLYPASGIADFDISEIDNLLYVFAILSPITSIVNYKYITIKELNDISLNPNLLPSTKEGYWSKLGKRIRVLISGGSKSIAMDIALVKNPDISEWKDYDFEENGYGYSFLQAVISNAVDKFIAIATRRGV